MARPANPPLLVALSALHFTLFPIPVITLFWKDHVGMSLADIMLLQAIFGLAVAALEFPSGALADRVGYRASLLIGAALWAAGWALYAPTRSFAAVALAEVVLGAGNAFLSGADRALLWASLEAGGQRGRYLAWEARLRGAGQAAEAASAAAGGWLYGLAPRLPLWLQLPVALGALGAVLATREPARGRRPAERSHWRRAGGVLRLALLGGGRLRAALGLSVAFGLSSFVLVWLIQPLAQRRGLAPGWLGPFWAAAHLLLVAVSLATPRLVAGLGRRGVLVGCWALVPLGYAGLVLSESPAGLAFYACFMALRGLQAPVLTTVLQEEAPGEDRAAVLSLAALLFRLAFVLAAPPIGLLADRHGLERALGWTGLVLTALSLAALRVFLRADRPERDGRPGSRPGAIG